MTIEEIIEKQYQRHGKSHKFRWLMLLFIITLLLSLLYFNNLTTSTLKPYIVEIGDPLQGYPVLQKDSYTKKELLSSIDSAISSQIIKHELEIIIIFINCITIGVCLLILVFSIIIFIIQKNNFLLWSTLKSLHDKNAS
jgi:hypothetical protein